LAEARAVGAHDAFDLLTCAEEYDKEVARRMNSK